MSPRPALLVLAAIASAACAKPASSGAAAAPSPAVQEVIARAAAAQPVRPAAQAPAPAAAPLPKNIDPVGTWVINLVAGGNPLTVTARIEKKTDGTFGGNVTSDVTPPLPINWVKVDGKSLKLSVTGPDGTEAVINLTVEGDDVTGEWTMGADGSKVTGKKLP